MIRIATRTSRLAVTQARRVAELLTAAHPAETIELVGIESSGDRDRRSPVAELTEIGAFVRSVQQVVIDGRADVAVHSLKDLPVAEVEGLVRAAYPERQDPRDVLVGAHLDDLPAGAVVGTGSPRRAAQLRHRRPDLQTVELRGNVDTRLRRVADGEVDAAILAAAGLRRLGRAPDTVEYLDWMVPAPGQGVLAVEVRAGDRRADAIDDGRLRRAVDAERGLLAATGAGCRSALGAYATWEGDTLRMVAFVDDELGPRRCEVAGTTPEQVVDLAGRELQL